jgi:hypothetical protein
VFLYHSAASGPIQGVKKAQLEILGKGVIKDPGGPPRRTRFLGTSSSRPRRTLTDAFVTPAIWRSLVAQFRLRIERAPWVIAALIECQ